MAPGQRGAKMAARQVYSVTPAAFAWDADIRIGGMPFYGLDYLSENEGVFSARLLGLIQVASGSDREIRRSSMLRYLGELAWLPYAAVGNDAIRWEAVDERRARVHFTSGGETVSGVFEFDDEGRPVAFSAVRPRDVDGRSEPTPRRGAYWDFVRVEGVEVPVSAKVSWDLPEGPFTYWEARMQNHRFVR